MLFSLLSNCLSENFVYVCCLRRGIWFLSEILKPKKADGFIADMSIVEVLKPILSSPPCCYVR